MRCKSSQILVEKPIIARETPGTGFEKQSPCLVMDVVFTQTWDWEDEHLVIRERMIQNETGVEGLTPKAQGPRPKAQGGRPRA